MIFQLNFISLIIFYIYVTGSAVNCDKEYIVTFPPMMANFGQMCNIYITNPNTRWAYLQISTPLLNPSDPNYFFSRSYYVPNEDSTVITFNAWFCSRGQGIASNPVGCITQNRGILIRSSQDILVQIANVATQLAMAIWVPPVSSLGTKYIATHYYEKNPPYTPPIPYRGPYGIIMTGTVDNTNITVLLHSPVAPFVLCCNGKNYTQNGKLKLTIDRFQVIEVQLEEFAGQDLSGTLITSDQPIQVISSMAINSVQDKTRDQMADLNNPIDQLGNEYYFMPTPARSGGDILRLYSTDQPATYQVLDKAGSLVKSGIIPFYQFVDVPTTGTAYGVNINVYTIRSNTSIQVAVMGKSYMVDSTTNDDNYMMMLRPLSLPYISNQYHFSTVPEYDSTQPYTNCLLMIVPTNETKYIYLNGASLRNFIWIPFYGSHYSGSYVTIPAKSSSYNNIENLAGGKIIVYLVGGSSDLSFGTSLLSAGTTEYDPNQGWFHLMMKDNDILTKPLGCYNNLSRLQCSGMCLQQRSKCAGFVIDEVTRKCCLHNDSTIKFYPILVSPGKDIYQWKEDYEMMYM